MAKNIDDCQTANELADAIGEFLKQGGGLYLKTIGDATKGTITNTIEPDDVVNTNTYGRALNKYNELRKSNHQLLPLTIDASDPLSGLAQIQQLCAKSRSIEPQEKGGQSNGGKVDSPNEKSSETWYWNLYEKTIKAVIATILDFLIK